MPFYQVAVTWTMHGYVTVELPENSSQDDIINAAADEPLPLDANYVDDSFEVDKDDITLI